MHVLRRNHGQQENTNEFTDEEMKECGMEIDSSGDVENEEDIFLAELLSGPDSDQDTIATSSREREHYSINESEKIWFIFQSDSDEQESSLQTVDFFKKLIRVTITEPNMKHNSINPLHFFMPCGH